jgi:phage terminase small subunit
MREQSQSIWKRRESCWSRHVPRTAGLTEKQKAFVAEYLIDMNATAAARRAGYKGRHVDSIACRLVSKSHVQAAISTAQAERAQRLKIDADAVLQEVATIAFQHIVEMTDKGPKLRPAAVQHPDAGKAVAAMKIKRRPAHGDQPAVEILEFRMHNKLDALRDLMRHLGMFQAEGPPVGAAPGAINVVEVVLVDGDRVNSARPELGAEQS